MLPAVPLLLAGLGWWGAGSLASKTVKPQVTPSVPQINLPAGIEVLVPAGPRPPLGYLELTAFGFSERPKEALAKAKPPRVKTAGELYVVDSILSGSSLNTATIGDKTVKAGDKLDKKYTVVSVVPDGVWVIAAGPRSKQEKIGFRQFVVETIEAPGPAGNPAPGARVPLAPGSAGADSFGVGRDFRQILETLKL